MKTPPESAQQPLPDKMGETIAELRTLLAVPVSKRSADWQSILGTLVGALCVDFSKQESQETALVQISLVSLAAQKGSKDAKKRVIKPARWISSAPPSLSRVFDDIDEARSAIRVLQPIRADWVTSYVCGELSENKWPDLTSPLVTWLLKVVPTVESFLHVTNAVSQPSNSTYAAWVAAVLRNAVKVLSKAPSPAGDALMSEVAESASRIAEPIAGGSGTSDQLAKAEARQALLALLSQVSSFEPSVLVQGAGVAALRGLCKSSDERKGRAPLELETLCHRTISMLKVLTPGADKTQLAHYRDIWKAYSAGLPRAEQLLKNAAKGTPALNLLQASTEDRDETAGIGVTAGLETILCELVVNWDDYYVHHLGDPAAQQLGVRIDELIRQLGVARFGETGQVVAFDPVRHHLADSSSARPGKVRISKPGLVLERPDGTSRVLLMAAVSPFQPS